MTKTKGAAVAVPNQGGAALAVALETAGPRAQTRLNEALGKGGGYVSHIIAGRFKPGYAGRLKIARLYKVAGALWDVPIKAVAS